MKKLYFIAFCLKLNFCLAESPALLLSTAIRINKIKVLYPTGVISERDLRICQQKSACNIIHKRFWLPPLLERLCRCPYRNECPWTWSSGDDNQTIYLNNRSQFKFCTDLTNLPNCTTKKPALEISTLLSEEKFTHNRSVLQNEKTRRHSEHRNVTLFCNCQEPHYWKLKANSTNENTKDKNSHQLYYCSKLKKCARFDFCGHVRLDTHSTYYRCSCPKEHMCITKNKTIYDSEEILYSGDSYKSYCLPHRPKLPRTKLLK